VRIQRLIEDLPGYSLPERNSLSRNRLEKRCKHVLARVRKGYRFIPKRAGDTDVASSNKKGSNNNPSNKKAFSNENPKKDTLTVTPASPSLPPASVSAGSLLLESVTPEWIANLVARVHQDASMRFF
jgi:hypothetical protein